MKFKYQILFSSSIIIIILGVIPAQIILSSPQLDIASSKSNIASDHIERLTGENKESIPRLMNEKQVTDSDDMKDSQDFQVQPNQVNPNFAIGSQQGTGGGNYRVNDSLNLTYNENLDTSNSWYSVNHTDGFTIAIPSGFTNNSGVFNISNVKAEFDYRAIEGDSVALYEVTSQVTNTEVAMEFSITEEYANLSSIFIRVEGVDTGTPDFTDPTGEILIVNGSDSSGDWKPVEDEVLTTSVALGDNGWHEYTLNENVTLSNDRHYFVILNDTSITAAYWEWGVQTDKRTDLGDGIDEGNYWFKDGAHSEPWVLPIGLTSALDLDLVLNVIPVEKPGIEFVQKTYNSPNEICLLYNTSDDETNLTRFDWFNWNGTSDNTHRFQSNTSVSFDLLWIANLTYSSNPILTTSSYLTLNNSNVLWCITYSSTSVSTSYDIRNHTFSITGLQNDWDGRAIYHGTTLVYNSTNQGLFNNSVTYTNKSSSMIINASTLATATDWNITFDAPNYIDYFNISFSGTLLDLPYRTYSMNDYDLLFEIGETGNLTYWIDYPNGSQLLKQNINDTHTSMSDSWDIDSTFDSSTNQNGTYQLQALWNNSDLTKVGTYTRNVTMFINTSFSTVKETEVIISQDYNITAYYTSNHNSNTDILNAPIWCEANWTAASDKWMTQNVTDDSYNASFSTSGETEGTKGNLTIITKTPWFENWTETIIISFVAASSIDVNTSSTLSLEWRENATLEINYSKSSDGSGINPGAIFDIDGSMITPTWDGGDEVYRFEFNSTDYGGEGTHSNINITASHSSFLDQTWTFDLEITPGVTNISCSNPSIINNTAITRPYVASSNSIISFNLEYYHELTDPSHDNPLNTTIPSINSPIPVYSTIIQGNSSWNIQFDCNETGVFALEITFSLGNYTDALFVINLTVEEADTQLQTIFTNNTQIDYNNQLIFTLFFNNTDWNENITFGGNNTIYINDSTITFLNRVGEDFRFEIATTPIPAGRYTVNITFEVQYYKSSSIIVIFEVIADTEITTTTNLANEFGVNDTVISSNTLNFYLVWHTEYGVPIIDDTDVVSNDSSLIHTSSVSANGTHYFSFTAGSIGTTYIELTFNRTYFNDLTIVLSFLITDRFLELDQDLTTYSDYITILNLEYGDYFYFSVFLNDSLTHLPVDATGVSGISSYNITLTNTNNGNHTFLYNATFIGNTGSITMTFSLSNYQDIDYHITFVVIVADSTLLSQPSEITTTYTQPINFSVIWQKEPNSPVAPFTPTFNITTTWIGINTGAILAFPAVNGNYTFTVFASSVTSFTLIINFYSHYYENQSLSITVTINPVPSTFGALSNANNSELGSITPFYYSNNMTISITILETFNNTGIEDTSPTYSGNGSSLVSYLISYSNGTHFLLINASIIGILEIQVTFSFANFETIIFVLYANVSIMPTVALEENDFEYDESVLVENSLYVNGTGFKTTFMDDITVIDSISLYMNGTLVAEEQVTINVSQLPIFSINFSTTDFQWGKYNLTIKVISYGYQSQNITLSIILIADTVFADHSPNLVTGVTNASVISGNSLDFWIVWETEYGTAIVDSDVESNDTAVVHTGYDAGNGTHYFTFTAGSIGTIHINLTFNRSYVYDLNLTLHFEITDRGLVIADEPLTTHEEPYTSATGYLHYGDRYYFYVFINDSVDESPQNITAVDITTSTNVTFVNITTTGRHLFYFDAWIIARSIPTSLTIQFNKLNYASVGYQISFFVDYADSELQSAPSSVNTYYNQNVNFTLIWQKSLNPNAPFSLYVGINNTGSSQLPAYVEFKKVNNGNFTFQINAIQAGTYVVTLEFISSVFQNQTHQVTINIYQIPTEFEFGSSTYSNNSIVGTSGSLFNYSEIHTFIVTWNDSFSNSGIQDSSPQFLGNGSSYLNLTNIDSNGLHTFNINASALGYYYVTIRFETTNFAPSIYGIYFNISTMLTLPLNRTNFVVNEEILDSVTIEILVESNISLFGYGYQTYKGGNISLTENDFTIWMNGSSVNNLNITIDKTEFTINFTTLGYQWGTYNLTFTIAPNGYQSRTINVTITLLGRSITLTVSLPVTTINQGESIEISAALEYASLAGIGAGVTLASLAGVDIDFYIGLIYSNGTKYFEYSTQTDASGEASYLIDGRYTQSATGFANITVMAASSFSGLPSSYSMSSSELGEYKIVKFLNPLEILLPAAIILIILVTIVGSVYVVNRRRKTRVATRVRGEQKVEQSFEDIKSIRLILARHESGLQFYSESTITDLATDTDALSGMSAAISSFMEEISGSMASRSGEVKTREIEMMSREGLHMLIWHGTHSSLIIISEVRLPDYFQERLKKLGNTLEKKYEAELLNFYSSDQIPSSVVKKMVRNFIPLHYFSAFILNEGVLTLESIKLSGKERKMLKYVKEIQFVKEGIQFFFSEQIISQLSKKWKRSEAIKFLNKSIDLNLLIEASQEDLLDLQK